MLRSQRTVQRWESTKCTSHYGSIVFTDFRSRCEKAGGNQFQWDSNTIGGSWKITVTFADRGTGWIGVYLSPTSLPVAKSTCAHLKANLKHGERILASYDMKEKPYDFGPQRKYPQYTNWGERNFCSMDEILKDESMRQNEEASFEYVIAEYPDDFATTSPSGYLSLQPSLPIFRSMMGSMFDNVEIADVCFIIRHSAASKDRPRRLYALTKILMLRCDYFRILFGSHFIQNEDSITNPESFDAHRWELGSDSDYDDEEIAEKANEDEEQTGVYETETISRLESEQERSKNPIKRKVYIMDSSYRTYRALLYYLYTGCIALAPLRSTYNAAKEKTFFADADCRFPRRSTYNDENALIISLDGERGDIQWVSAKSMYRLCDKLDIADLKAAAAQFIHDSLTPETVLHELRSTFSPLFPEIYQDQKTYLEEHWSAFCRTKSFETYMADLFANDLGDHAMIMLNGVMSAVKGSKDKESGPDDSN